MRARAHMDDEFAGTALWRRNPDQATLKNKCLTKQPLGALVNRYQPVGLGRSVANNMLSKSSAAPYRVNIAYLFAISPLPILICYNPLPSHR